MKENPHKPYRTCVYCRKKFIKWDLHRFVLKEGEIYPDPKQILPGRGAYLCDECFFKRNDPKLRSRLMKALKGEVKR